MPKLAKTLLQVFEDEQVDQPGMWVGIDPGKSGGIATITRVCVSWEPMPVTERDLWNMLGPLGSFSPFCLLEQVHAMPKQGVTSMFTFGQGYGTLRGMLVAAGIPFDVVTPQAWLKSLGIPSRKRTEVQREWKDRIRAKAQQLFPDLTLWGETLGKQRAVCDALLIAEVCRRTR